MLPPECAFVLPNGKPCAQFARRGRRFCRFHEKDARMEKTVLENRRIRAQIASLDLQGLLVWLQETLDDVLHHRITPDRQQMIYESIFRRSHELFIEAQINDATNPNSPWYDPNANRRELTDRYIRDRSLAYLNASPAERTRPPRMEDLFGPRMAGAPVPPNFNLEKAIAAMDHLREVSSATYAPAAPENPATAAGSAR